MLRILGVCAAMALAAGAHAQSLVGTITDGEAGTSLPGATVRVPTLDAGTASDGNGHYALPLPAAGTVRVVFSYVGYKTETRSVYVGPGSTTVDVVLTPSFIEAPAVTVTARAGASDVLSTPQSVEVVDDAAVARAASGSPLDVLDNVAGVRLLRTGPGIVKPVVRGVSGTRVLLVQDGIRQEGQYWGDEHGAEVGSADVDGIEVVRGPSSLIYGSDALGGVVQTTRRDLFQEAGLRGQASVRGISSTRQWDSEFDVGGRVGRVAWEGRFGYLRAGHVDTPAGLVPNTAQERGTGSVRLGYQFAERSTVVVEAGRYEGRTAVFEVEDEPDPDAEEAGRFTIGEPYLRTRHDRAAARLQMPVGANRVEVVGSLQQNRLMEFGHEHGGVEPEPHEEGEAPAVDLRLTTAAADFRLHHRPLGPVFGTIGVGGLRQRNETLGEETLIPGAVTLNGAAFVSQHLVLPAVTLDAGLRVDARRMDVATSIDLGILEHSRAWTAVTGAVGTAWQPRSDLSLAANLGRAFRAPTLQELFSEGVHEGTLRYERGEPSLGSETALSLDGVVRYLTPHLFAEASVFVNQIDGYIFARPTTETDSASGLQVFQFGQANARLAGAEGRFDLHPHGLHGLGVHLAGDLLWGINRETDEPLPLIPPARLRAAVEYTADRVGPVHDVEARIGPTFTAAQNRPSLPAEVPTDGYVTWDASAAAAFPLRGGMELEASLSVDNLLDAEYIDPMSRFRPYGVPAEGRSVRLRLAVEW